MLDVVLKDWVTECQAEHERDNDPGQHRLRHSLPAAPALGKKSCSRSILYSAMIF